MTASPTVLERDGGAQLLWIAASVIVSLALHLSVASAVSQIEVREPEEPEWVEMVVQDVTPPPPPEPEPVPEPEPEPEPQPPPEVPEVVQYEPKPETPPPVPAARPVPVPVQGLTNDSFLPGTDGGAVRAGNTTGIGQTDRTMTLDEADEAVLVPYGSVTNPPKVRFKGLLEVPEAVRAAGIEGQVQVVLTIDAEGKVTAVDVVGGLHPDADAACAAWARKTRWKPGDKDGVPVVTVGVPYLCTFKMTPG